MITTILQGLVRFLETIIEWSGKLVSWLTLFMVLAVVLVLILRHGFGLSAIPLKESVTYMHALVFMIGAAYTFKHNEHVRVDVFYQKFSPRKKAWVEILGFVFLLIPVCWFIYHYSINTVALNWALETGSNDPGGIPYLYILMGLLLVLPVSLFMQGLASSLKNVLFLMGQGENPNHSDFHEELPHA
ncbi:MAG: TRAP transporter small permease subunit [Gammaproteobacteria bacterium]|nr:TRAP transporter small permease subunit [Gammaproteobacteria bacterium]